jgi:hypothetical protein
MEEMGVCYDLFFMNQKNIIFFETTFNIFQISKVYTIIQKLIITKYEIVKII